MSHTYFLSALATSGCIGLLSAYLAFKQNRNPYLWFFIGIFFGLLGMMAIFIFSPKKRINPKEPQSLPTEQTIIGPADKFWYYLDSFHQQKGPMSLQALKKTWKEGSISGKTYVWHEDLSNWKLLEECLEEKK